MVEYYYIAIPYNHLCIAGSYNTKEDAERDLPIFPKDSKVFPSECPSVGDKVVVNRARELIYTKQEIA